MHRSLGNIDSQSIDHSKSKKWISILFILAHDSGWSTLRQLFDPRNERGEECCEPSYVESSAVPRLSFFSTKIELSPEGVGKIHPIGELSVYEQGLNLIVMSKV
jgi:hypothetical protein